MEHENGSRDRTTRPLIAGAIAGAVAIVAIAAIVALEWEQAQVLWGAADTARKALFGATALFVIAGVTAPWDVKRALIIAAIGVALATIGLGSG